MYIYLYEKSRSRFVMRNVYKLLSRDYGTSMRGRRHNCFCSYENMEASRLYSNPHWDTILIGPFDISQPRLVMWVSDKGPVIYKAGEVQVNC